MTLEQFTAAWPVWVWLSLIVFFAGRSWWDLHRLRSDFSKIEPMLAKVPVLEVRVDTVEGELQRVRDRVHDANNAAQKALLAVAAQGD